MTEQEWLTSTDPAPMLAFARDRLTEEQLRCYLNALIGRELPWSGLVWMKFIAADSEVIHKNPVRSCDLLRCVAGNPFRPVALHLGTAQRGVFKGAKVEVLGVADPAWLTPAVVALARGVLEGDTPAWDRMPILADALEEAGCPTGFGVLEHLRNLKLHLVTSPAAMSTAALESGAFEEEVWLPGSEPAAHCEGCWVLRLLLGEGNP